MNKISINKINFLFIIFLCLYIFCGELIVGITQIGFLKVALASLSVLFFVFSILTNKLTSLDVNIYLFVTLLFSFYLIWWGSNLGNYNLFVTILYGYVLAKHNKQTILILKIIFFIQLLAVTYEVFTHSFIYKEVSSGILKNNNFNFESAVELFEETGFRAKGLFQGTLVASSFIIYIALIFRNNKKILFFNVIMALLVNGRLAILIALLTFIIKHIKSLNISMTYKKISNNIILLFLIPFIIFVAFIVLYTVIPDNMRDNLLSTFDLKTNSNAGRLYRMLEGLSAYLNQYSISEKLLGKVNYELYDIWNRPVPPEAEFIGMLLDIGLIGLSIYLYFLFKIYSKKRDGLFNVNIKELGYNYTVVINLIAIFIYRHCLGNVRGAMFWFLVFSAIIEFNIFKNKTNLYREKESLYN